MNRKLLFLDLDGTLLDDRKQITPGNQQALDRALEAGHGVIITTGRPLKSAMDQAHKLGLDKPGCYLIAYNGAVVYDWTTREQIFSRTLAMDTVDRVFRMARELDVHVQTYDTWDILVEPAYDNAAVRRYCGLINMTHRVVDRIPDSLTEEPVKVLIVDYDAGPDLKAAENWLRENLSHITDCFFSCDAYLEVVPKGMNKGDAVRRMCAMLSIPIENAVAVGDAANDLTMIAAAGTGVAMANGTGEVKAIADYITLRDNNHDGIAEVVEKFFCPL